MGLVRRKGSSQQATRESMIVTKGWAGRQAEPKMFALADSAVMNRTPHSLLSTMEAGGFGEASWSGVEILLPSRPMSGSRV
jgi:hypothetical protein